MAVRYDLLGVMSTNLAEAAAGVDAFDETAIVASAAFANPWHDEAGRFAPKGTGRKFAAVVRNGREPSDLEALFDEPPQSVIDAVDNYMQYVKYGYNSDELGREANDAYEAIDAAIDAAITTTEGRLFPSPALSRGDHVTLKRILVERASREKFRQEVLAEYAAEHGQTPKQVEAAIEKNLAKALKGKPVSTRMTDDTLAKMLDDGEFKTQFETGESTGGNLDREARQFAEAAQLGLDPSRTPDEERPIYGYIAMNPNDAADIGRSTLDQYGDVRVEFNDDIRDRTTFTVGDSLAGVARPSPLSDPSFSSVGYLQGDFDDALSLDGRYENRDDRTTQSKGYVEAQIHGNVTSDDIARVVLRYPSSDITDRLDRLGIEWAVVGEEQALAAAGPPPPDVGAPLFTDGQGATIHDAGWSDELNLPLGYIVRDGERYEPRALLALLAHGDWSPVSVTASAAFANPWHDEIGRFAPKGYVRSGAKISRDVTTPRNQADGDAVNAAMDLYNTVTKFGKDANPTVESFKRLVRLAKAADEDLVERLIKPASRAMSDGNMDEARSLIEQASDEVLTTFTEEFEVPEPEQITIKRPKIDVGISYTTTPEGRRIWFDPNGHRVTDAQIYTILSAATTAARAGNLHGVNRTAGDEQYDDTDLHIKIQAAYDEDGFVTRNTMGYVNVNENVPTRHRTVHLTPELIAGKFDPGGPAFGQRGEVTGSAATVETLRWTTLHEVGHVSIFEEVMTGRGKEWFNRNMAEMEIPINEIPLTSRYGRENTVEMHAEMFAEWANTGGRTNNPVVLRYAEQFGWSDPRPDLEDLPLAASGGPS